MGTRRSTLIGGSYILCAILKLKFDVSRPRWRAQRRPFRARELEADARDRATEAQQLALLHKESEDFLERQADMFAKITEGKNRAIARSLPAAGQDDAIKLSFGGAVAPKVAPKAPAPVRPAVLGIAEDEDEGKKKRELIPLSYSDDEDEKDSKSKAKPYRMTEREKERKARDIKDDIPEAKAALWVYRVEWSALTEVRQPLHLPAADPARGSESALPGRVLNPVLSPRKSSTESSSPWRPRLSLSISAPKRTSC